MYIHRFPRLPRKMLEQIKDKKMLITCILYTITHQYVTFHNMGSDHSVS